ncbi:MAG: SprT-like domain-containing protein [Bryobacteraceae bacterium]
MLVSGGMQVERALPTETPEEIYTRVFRELKPGARPPEICLEFRRYANPDSFARLQGGELRVRMSDLIEGAPAPVLEALAFLLLGKLLRKAVPARYARRYRLYLNRRDVRRRVHLLRQIRGRKFVSGPQGEHYDLLALFEELNAAYFHGLMARPALGWSRRPSRTSLGHFDPLHNAIIISRLLDDPVLPRLVLEYVLFHEMLHLRYPVQERGSRRRVHPREFQEAEKEFPGLKQAKEMLKKL